MNKHKLEQCLNRLDALIADFPDVLKEDAARTLMRELDVDYVDAGLAVHVWAQLRSQLDPSDPHRSPPGWTDV